MGLLLHAYCSCAAYLSRPELVDYNFANAIICDQAALKIKFDYENFTGANVFSVQISAPGGSFANPTTLTGTLQASGSQQNVVLTVTVPAGVPAGSNYRLRVKGTNPLTYSSQLNEYPFAITKLGISDPNLYPTDFWRGYVYTWTPSTTGTITDASAEDIFNPARYAGYIVEDSLSFDYNWGNNGMAPGLLPDSSKVCGSYKDNFAIRMRRRINFEAGYYVFGGGADDGFRLSLDGGTTWLINDWSDHTYRGTLQNGGCGVQITAGLRDVVCEFYEHTIDAHFRCIIIKTGDPAVDPISILNPANGASICSGTAPFQMTANPGGAWQWSGTGVSPNGMLNPAIGGTGPRTITYQTGYNAFGLNCVKSTSITVNIQPGPSAQFSGLQNNYCINSQPSTLIPQNGGGAFSGAGVSGNLFSPQAAGAGTHIVRYITAGTSGCVDTANVSTTVYALPDAGFAPLPDSICVGSANIVLVPNTPGGQFIGQGVVPPNLFSPAILLSSNQYLVEYRVTQNGCTNQSSQYIYILDKLKPTLSFPTLKNKYCTSDEPFVPVSTPQGRFFLNGLEVLEINPAQFGAGNYELKAIYRPETALSCIDSASAKFQFTIIANPRPDLGPDREVEAGLTITLDPKVGAPYQWTAEPALVTGQADKPLSFSPEANVVIQVWATDPSGLCAGADEVALTVRAALEFPNLFTPNGDSHNQEWRIKGAYPNMKVAIYNRWGKEVYSGITDGDVAWTGAGAQPDGTYFYTVTNPADGRQWNGAITIIR